MSHKAIAGYQALLDAGVQSGELRSCDTPALARAISATAGGSLIAWAVFREGTAEQWVRADIETLLTLYCTMSVRSSRKRRKR